MSLTFLGRVGSGNGSSVPPALGLAASTYSPVTQRGITYNNGTAGFATGNGAGYIDATVASKSDALHVFRLARAGMKLCVPFGAYAYGTDVGNGVIVTAATVEYPHASGIYYDLKTADGSTSFTVPNGATVLTYADLTSAGGYTAAALMNIRTYVDMGATPAAGTKIPQAAVLQSLDRWSASNTAVNSTKVAFASHPTGQSVGYGPAAPLGDGAGKSIALLGDSILQGLAEGTVVANGVGLGYGHRAAYAAGLGVVDCGRHAEVTAEFFSAKARHRRLLALNASHALEGYGANDLVVAGTTWEHVASTRFAIWRFMERAGVQVRAVTVMPRPTSSTDTWATVENQTVATARDAIRVPLNNWLRDGAPVDGVAGQPLAAGASVALRAGSAGHPLTSYYDIADAVESARDSGKWKAAYTTDGVHPLSVGHAAAAAAVDLTTLTANPRGV